MTDDCQAEIDDATAVRYVLRNTEALLLDFDGPVCSVFSGFPAPVVADQLRAVLSESAFSSLPAEIETSEDPFDVFKHAARIGENEARYVESALRAHEVEAVQTAEPTPYSHQLIKQWSAIGRPMAIVSNNSAEAVSIYLEIHGLTDCVTGVVSRTSSDPGLLKPNPHLVSMAVQLLNRAPENCTLVGDSSSDMDAANSAKVAAIGYANKPGKASTLRRPGVKAILSTMRLLLPNG
ncbi:HAD family phosphatase [Streptomyces sp. ID05-26A]|nr:HAD family phosphatase [Streptomyces sp. ID05-26A]